MERIFGSAEERVEFIVQKFWKRFAKLSTSEEKAGQLAFRWIQETYPQVLKYQSGDGVDGPVPGVPVGSIFKTRWELMLVGLHGVQAGIYSKEVNGVTIALSVVASGGNEDDKDDGETLVYTGEGGRKKNSDRKGKDQVLQRGNMALVNSYLDKKLVRVIRSTEVNAGSTEYSYDGLYRVKKCRTKIGLENFKVFKFTLVRQPGQTPLRK